MSDLAYAMLTLLEMEHKEVSLLPRRAEIVG
jgi:hypothetical protein